MSDCKSSKALSRMTAYELGETGSADAIPYLISMLGSSKSNDVRLAASGIGKLARRHCVVCNEAVPDLLAALDTPHPQVRQYVLKALSKLDIGPSHSLVEVRRISEADEAEYNRVCAHRILSQTEPGSRPLIREKLDELEQLYRECGDDLKILDQILHEVSCRKRSKRKQALATDVQSKMEAIGIGKSSQGNDLQRETKAPVNSLDTGSAADLGDRSGWEKHQRTIVEYDAAGSLLVDAGPGSGKTHVACCRVAELINSGLDSSQILLISFTRAAIRELRERIESFAGKKSTVAGLKIVTLDSFTWEILRGLSGNEPASLLQGYNENIQQFNQLLDDPNPDLRNFLDELEHVIVDEAQDLIEDRADLVIRLIQKLPDNCGFTVFADPAQSIYGFTSEAGGSKSRRPPTLVDRIRGGEVEGFLDRELKGNFRTADPALIKLFSVVRQRLLGKGQSDANSWTALKTDISEMSHGEVDHISKQNFAEGIETLVLCRTRGEVLQGSSFLRSRNVPHKIRMSGIRELIHPWIGRVFSEFPEDSISRSQFVELWAQKIGSCTAGCQTETDPEAAWQLLEGHAWNRKKVSVRRLREILMRARPPVDFIVDEKFLAGPVIGTIHSSKGREAERVHLMLPPDSFISSDRFTPDGIAEEERVLFVGATRAKTELLCGKGTRTYLYHLESSNRGYRHPRGRTSFQIEVGLRDDIDYDSMVNEESGLSVDEMVEIQELLWEQRAAVLPVYSAYEKPDNGLWCEHDGTDHWIGNLSAGFQNDLYALAKKMTQNEGTRMNPPQKIPYLWMTGVTTRIIPPGIRDTACPPYRETGFMLAPVVTGFPTVRFFPAHDADAD